MSIFSKIKAQAQSARLKTKAIAAGFMVATASIVAAATFATAAASPVSTPNCDNNAVIPGGAANVSALQEKDRNGASCKVNGVTYSAKAYSIQDIYHWFDISPNDISSMGSDTVNGYVTKSGDVYAGNTLVATNALTAGRQFISGSTREHYGATTFYTRPPRVSFLNDELSAMVVMKNGVFQFAILNSCGNPVKASAKKPAYSINKEVRAGTSGSYSKNVTVKSGSTVEYQITVDSTGQVPAENVTVHDTLPNGITYDNGTLQENGKTVSSSNASKFFAHGLNVGTIKNGDKDVFTFEAKAGAVDYNDSSCKPASMLNNTGYISAPGLNNQQSNAEVSTTCAPVTLACESLVATPGTVNETTGDTVYTLQATAAKSGAATITKYVFTPGDGSANISVNTDKTTASATHTYAPGTWNATVMVSGIDSATGKPIPSAANQTCKATLTVKTPGKPNYAILKQVRAGTTGSYSSNVTVKSGTTVEYQITVSSTGQVPVTNVNLHDTLPSDITYTAGTLEENGTPVSATNTTAFFNNGMVIPSIANGSKDVFTFDAVAGNANYNDPTCKAETLTNTGYISTTDLSNQQSSANVSTTCTPPSSSLVCDSLTVIPGDINQTTADQAFAFTAKATPTNTTITSYKFTFNGSQTMQPVTIPSSANEVTTQSMNFAPGSWTATVTVTGTESSGTTTSATCTAHFKVPTPECQPGVPAGSNACYQYTCNQDQLVSAIDNTNRTVSISGFNATTTNPNATLTGVLIDWGDGSTATVSPSSISSQTPQTHDYAAAPANGITVTPQFTVAGQTQSVPGTACAIPVSFTTTTVPPTSLPNTGAGDTIGIFLGAVAAGTVGFRLFIGRKLARR